MKLLADENLPRQIVEQLRRLGHDVVWAAEMSPGMEDANWLAVGRHEGRVLITDDKDFGEMVFRKRENTAGIVLLRLYRLPLAQKVLSLEMRWPDILQQARQGLAVVTESAVRSRRRSAAS